jgi:hypothetical protein
MKLYEMFQQFQGTPWCFVDDADDAETLQPYFHEHLWEWVANTVEHLGSLNVHTCCEDHKAQDLATIFFGGMGLILKLEQLFGLPDDCGETIDALEETG